MTKVKPYYCCDNVYTPSAAPNPADKIVVEGELTLDWDAVCLDDEPLRTTFDEHLNFDPVKSSWGRVRITIERLE